MSEIGFCSRCKLMRQNDNDGLPVTPCVCFVEHHAKDCQLRIAIASPIALPCDVHRADACVACFPCTCGVAADRMFICGALVFVWEGDLGLIPTMRLESPPP